MFLFDKKGFLCNFALDNHRLNPLQTAQIGKRPEHGVSGHFNLIEN